MQASDKNNAARFARVAIQCPVDSLFDYVIEDTGAGVKPGCRVRVPFRRREVTGLVMAVTDASTVAPGRLKAISALIDAQPLMSESTLAVMQWATRYYSAPIGEAVAMLPRWLRDGREARLPNRSVWQVSETGLASVGGLRGAVQNRLIETLVEAGIGLDGDALDERLGTGWKGAAQALLKRGLVTRTQVDACPRPAPEALHEIHLEGEQALACEAVVGALDGFSAFLLEGVTGSGKTEVFIMAARAALERGRQVLVLVPEIGLTPQTLERFRRSLPAPVVALHSGMTDKARFENWLFARSGAAGVVIGTRSAAFVEMPRLGLIVVDEEHDGSFKQQQSGMRYSARDSAVVRARTAGIPIVLASATPSLESLQNAKSGRYRHLTLTRRASGAQMPRIRIIDIDKEPSMRDGLSHTLIGAMRTHLERGEQVMVFLNRRGFAPVLVCGDCGWAARCPNCDAHRVIHKAKHELMCHHCGHREPEPNGCPSCGSVSGLFPAGEGTQRVEERLIELFPGYPLERVDRDAVPGRAALEDALDRIATGEARILLGTQMLAKGHDFQNVTLVGILGTDAQLYSADFRSIERLGQTLVQVAGRAGRGHKPGVVMVQTRFPGHHAILALTGENGYREVADLELKERAETRLPPFGHMAITLARSPRAGEALSFLRDAKAAAQDAGPGVEVFGPMPTLIGRMAGEYRAQLVVSSPDRASLQRFLRRWVPTVSAQRSPNGLHWVVDVDPMTMQ
jgi:primosomal protein N' (replication factor Y)